MARYGPHGPFGSDLFPARWHRRVWASAAGVIGVHGLLVWWAVAAGSVAPVLAFYVGPLLVVNAWLVLYTWLQHSDHDIPHYGLRPLTDGQEDAADVLADQAE